jgi:hypothetical protein
MVDPSQAQADDSNLNPTSQENWIDLTGEQDDDEVIDLRNGWLLTATHFKRVHAANSTRTR